MTDRDETPQEWEAFNNAAEEQEQEEWREADRRSAAEIEWMTSRCARGVCLNEGTERLGPLYLCPSHYQEAVARMMDRETEDGA